MASTSSSSVRLGVDRTSAFRECLVGGGQAGGEEERDVLESRRRWEKQRDEALGPIVSEEFVRRCKALGNDRLSQREKDCLRLRKADEEWIGEAYKVNRTIASIVDFVRTIRRPYLASGASSSLSSRRTQATASNGGGGKERGAFSAWSGVNSLSDKERDEIEFQVKMTIKRCLARIKELEEGEEVRRRTTASVSINPFSRLLGGISSTAILGRSHPLYAEQLSQHRTAITQFLSNRLAQANARMGDLQEARLKAQRQKQINLAGSAALTTNANGAEPKRTPVAGSVSQSTRNAKSGKGEILLDELDSKPYQSDFSSSQLTAEQVQQFDKESSALIKSLTDDLRAVEQAERKLSEISEMQTQLIQHLGNQSEMADHLHQEALGHTLEVGKGNEQLKRAKENNRQASRFLCMFLIGSGLGLLFLHWMD